MSSPTFPPVHTAEKRRRRLPRLLALVATGVVLLVFLLPLAARHMIGADRLKTIAEQTLTNALGRRVSIDGDVSILFAPWFGVAMGPINIADAPGFDDKTMVAARRLEMTIRILPLLHKVVSPGSVRIRDLTLSLRRDRSGQTNWGDLTAPHTTAAADAPGWELAPEPRDIRLENASLDYRDEQTGRSLHITGANLKTGVGQPFNFSLAFTASGLVPGGQLECHAGGKASFDPTTGRLALHKTLVEAGLLLSRPLAPGGATPTRVVSRVTADYDPATKSLALTDLDVRFPGARLTGAAQAVEVPQNPKLDAHLRLNLNMAGKWREILGLTPAEGPGSLVAAPERAGDTPDPGADTETLLSAEATPRPGRAVLELSATAASEGLTVSDLTLALPQGKFAATARLRFGEHPQLDATVSATDVDFDALPGPNGTASWPWPLPWPRAGALDARISAHHCRLAGLDVHDAQATLAGDNGLLRLYPVSIALPGGLLALDARFDAGPAQDAPHPGGLGLDARAAVSPTAGSGQPAIPPSRVRLIGRLNADGARGNILVQSPDPAQAASVLGLGGLIALTTPLDAKGTFSLAPGVNHLVAKAALSGLEAKIAGSTVHGQVLYDNQGEGRLGFDLATDSLDLENLGSLTTTHSAGGNQTNGLQAEGKLRADKLVLHSLEAKNIGLDLTLANGRADGTIQSGEVFGGKLSGKIEADPAGHLTAALQLAGAEAGRLPGASGNKTGLSGPLTVKAGLEAARNAKGAIDTLAATVEASAAQLALGSGSGRQTLSGAKAVMTLKGHDTPGGPNSLDCDANLALTLASGFGLREVKATATGPISVDTGGHVKAPGPIKLDAAALWRPEETARPLKVAVSGPLTPDSAGGFSTGPMHLDAGGLAATLKIWRKADAGPTGFSLETGALSPRQTLTEWGVHLPAGLADDRLTKGSLSLTGSATGDGVDIKNLHLTLDDSTLTGSGSLNGFDPRRGKWTLNVDRLNWDAYFPHQPSSGPPSLAERRKPLDLKLLRELALEAKLSLGWFKKGNVTFDATSITAEAKGGQFTYRQESPHFYGGRFSADIRGDARDVALKTLVELKLESIEIAHFLQDWAEGNTLDSGSATFILAARTSGINELELRANLAGNASLQITRGGLKVRDPGSKPEQPTYSQIPFDVFSSSWLAKGGVAHSDDFRIDSPRMRVAGQGFVDLRDESINLSLMATLPNGGQVPATIIGPLDGPKLTIDRSKLLGDMVYRVLQGIVSIPGKAVTRILQLR